MKRIFISLLIGMSVTINIGDARILNVPEDCQTIQAGIDAAEDGDTVLVAPGEYVECIEIGHPILLSSFILYENDPLYIDSTVINGNDQASTISLQSDVVLRGFTVINGNIGEDQRQGGGIIVDEGDCIIEDMVIRDNTGYEGGGIYVSNCNVRLSRVLIEANLAQSGGGIYNGGSGLFLDHCILRNNNAVHFSVMLAYYGIIDFKSVSIEGNNSQSFTSIGIYGGGGANQPRSFDHVTMTNNTCEIEGIWDGGGITFGNVLAVSISNSIFFNNDGYEIIHYEGDDGDFPCDLSIAYSDIHEGLEEGIFLSGEIDLNFPDGNIDSDPLFLDPDNGDYSLTADSPCIDAGDPNSPPDPDGTRADMGAFYFDQRGEAPQIVEHFPVELELSLSQGDTLTFRIRAEDAEGDSIRYLWLFDEDTASVDTMLTVVFADTGEAIVQFHVSDGLGSNSISWRVDVWDLSVPPEILHSSLFALHSAYPNPFNSTTSITFSVEQASLPVRLAIYDLSGRLVADLLDGRWKMEPLTPSYGTRTACREGYTRSGLNQATKSRPSKPFS